MYFHFFFKFLFLRSFSAAKAQQPHPSPHILNTDQYLFNGESENIASSWSSIFFFFILELITWQERTISVYCVASHHVIASACCTVHGAWTLNRWFQSNDWEENKLDMHMLIRAHPLLAQRERERRRKLHRTSNWWLWFNSYLHLFHRGNPLITISLGSL